MASQNQSPTAILPMRMTLRIPENTALRFSVLDFPYQQAFKQFTECLNAAYRQAGEKSSPPLPYRRLNDGFLALSPSLIQGFEDGRMLAFTKYPDGQPEDFPSQNQIRSFIHHWLQAWGQTVAIETCLQGTLHSAWTELLTALKSPETQWQHGIKPSTLAQDLNSEKGLAYLALPALLTALLHEKTMIVEGAQGEQSITWRKAHRGGKNGLYLLSQPIPYQDDYFAYSLEFDLQTQAGFLNADGKAEAWVFANLGIQRYISQTFRKDKVENRAISALVAFNREGFQPKWDSDTSLIHLALEKKNGVHEWGDELGGLLNSFQVHELLKPAELLAAPQNYGNYANTPDFAENEYYLVYAEGRKFGAESARQHQVKTGTSLRERSQIMREVLANLNGFLEITAPFQKDVQAEPKKSFALRDYQYMLKSRKGGSAKQFAAWSEALQTSLNSTGHSHLQLIVLGRSQNFLDTVRPEIEKSIPDLKNGGQPLITVSYLSLPSSYYAALDAGELNPADCWNKNRPKDFWKQWNSQMRASYGEKREDWRKFLQSLAWDKSARRLVLIDSNGEAGRHDSEKIKGAIRDACHREGVLSQFIVGDKLKIENKLSNKRRYDKLSDGSLAKLRNALFDLLLRQQGLLFAPPAELYEHLAQLPKDYAEALDIIAFCRLQSNKPAFHYALAVRLRADGQVHVAFPQDSQKWIPYTEAAAHLGILFSEERVNLSKDYTLSPLRLKADALLNFVHSVLTQSFERSTLAVIEAEVWRNGKSAEEDKQCWTQLRNTDLAKSLDVLKFDNQRVYPREALNCLLGVVRLRMNAETPQYISADSWSYEETMRDIPHLTGYLDTTISQPLHYFSVAALSETQKDQKNPRIAESFKADVKRNKFEDIAYKHAQLVEMLPFFVHPDFQSAEVQKQLVRAIHFLRISPAFSSGNILNPYPLHLGVQLIEDQLAIIGADD